MHHMQDAISRSNFLFPQFRGSAPLRVCQAYSIGWGPSTASWEGIGKRCIGVACRSETATEKDVADVQLKGYASH